MSAEIKPAIPAPLPVVKIWPFVVAIVLASFTFRMIYTALSPLHEEIQHDLNISYGEFGLLAALPQFCAGLFSFSLPVLLRHFSAEQTALAGLMLISSMALGPLLGNELMQLYVLVALAGAGIAIAQPAVQAVIKHQFANRTMQMVALTILCMHIGSSTAAMTTHRLAGYFGDWRWSLLIYGLFSGMTVAWWSLAFRPWKASVQPQSAGHETGAWHLYGRASTWFIVFYFLNSGIIYISLLTWLPSFFSRLGYDAQSSANMLGLFIFCQAVAALYLSVFSREHWNRKILLYFAGITTLLGLILATLGVLPVALPVFAGLGLGVSFTVAMSLPHVYGKTPRETATLTMLALGLGSVLCAPFPFVIGWIKDMTHSEQSLLWITIGSCLFMLLTVTAFRRNEIHVGKPAVEALGSDE